MIIVPIFLARFQFSLSLDDVELLSQLLKLSVVDLNKNVGGVNREIKFIYENFIYANSRGALKQFKGLGHPLSADGVPEIRAHLCHVHSYQSLFKLSE